MDMIRPRLLLIVLSVFLLSSPLVQGVAYVAVDQTGEFYYEYETYIAKRQTSDDSVLAIQRLDNGDSFTDVKVLPDSRILFTSEANIGIFETSTDSFGQHNSYMIRYGTSPNDKYPRWDKLVIFDTKLDDSTRNTTYEFMAGGRIEHTDDTVDDIFFIMNGLYHGNNKTIEMPSYYIIDQGTNTNYQATVTLGSVLSENGFLALLEDTADPDNAVSLLKFIGGSADPNRFYEVNLMSFKRDMSQINWMNRYVEDYDSEAVFYNDRVYLFLTLGSDVFLRVISPSSGGTEKSAKYTLTNNVKLGLPQMTASNRFGYLYLAYQISETTSPDPAQYERLALTVIDAATLDFENEGYAFTDLGEFYSIAIIQEVDYEQLYMRGVLKTSTTPIPENKKFTIGLHPEINTQNMAECADSISFTFTSGSGSPNTVIESSLSGLILDASSSITPTTSNLTYESSPASLSSVTLCDATSLSPKEVYYEEETTFRTQGYTLVSISVTESVPSGIEINYSVLEPDSSIVDISVGSSYVTFNISQEYDLDENFILIYTATLSTLPGVYTTNMYNVTVGCNSKCTYCENNDECLVCNNDNLGFCEHMTSSDENLIIAIGWLIKFYVFIIAFRSIRHLKIDPLFWMLVNMFQVLRLITLLNVDIGLTLRNFLNDELKGFMIQIDINMLPQLLFSYNTTEERTFVLYGIESNLFMLYVITSILVIVATIFFLTFALAILECMKKTRNRLKCMIALANYLSLNMWIRGIYEFSLTLFIVGMLEIKGQNFMDTGVTGKISTLLVGIFAVFMLGMIALIIRFFHKNRFPDQWPKGIRELYDPLKPMRKSILAFNIKFIVKRLCLAIIVTFAESASGTTQLLLLIFIFIVSLIIDILFVRFSSVMTTVMYYITEGCCIACILAMHMFNNRSGIKSTFSIDMSQSQLDKVIIFFIFTCSTVIISICIVEAIIAIRNKRRERENNFKTGARAPKFTPRSNFEEEKWKDGTSSKLSNRLQKDMSLTGLDNSKYGRADSNLSKNTISNINERFEESKEHPGRDEPKVLTNLPPTNMIVNKLQAITKNRKLQAESAMASSHFSQSSNSPEKGENN